LAAWWLIGQSYHHIGVGWSRIFRNTQFGNLTPDYLPALDVPFMESGIQVKPQYFYLYQNPMSFFQPSGLQCFFHGGIQPGLEQKGDEIDCLGDSWFFFVWTSDSSPHSTHSAKSRWPICILPASLYAYANDVNISLEAVTLAITNSFNRLSTEGVKIRNLPSLGGNAVPLFEIISSDVHGLVFIFFEVCTDVYLVSLKSPCL